MLEESKPAIAKVVKYILEEQQNLRYEDSWPLPNGPRFWENTWGHAYGLFGGTFLPVHTTYYAVLTLNSTKKLHFLNQITPAASKAWYNLIIFSIIIGGVSSMGILVYEGLRVYKRKHDTLEGQLQTDLARNQKDSLFLCFKILKG